MPLTGSRGAWARSDTLVFQPMGSEPMAVGFAALRGALGRTLDAHLGVHPGGGTRLAAIVGSGPIAGLSRPARLTRGNARIRSEC